MVIELQVSSISDQMHSTPRVSGKCKCMQLASQFIQLKILGNLEESMGIQNMHRSSVTAGVREGQQITAVTLDVVQKSLKVSPRKF